MAGVVAGVLLAVGVLAEEVAGVLLDDELDVVLDEDEDEDEEVVVGGVVVGGVDEVLVSDAGGSGSARTKVTFRLTAGVPVAFFTVSV